MSQEPLRVDGEAVFRVPPLSLPGPGVRLSGNIAARYDAVALFVQRARAANPTLVVDDAAERAITELCRRLDGLPLAIELAAAGSRVLPLDSLIAEADRPHDLFASGSRSAPARHQTLRAALDYSHDRCDDASRALWWSMSVFRGGADLEAVEEVCGSELLGPAAIRTALSDLVDKSVLTFDGRRYRMLETVRGYGEEKLVEAGWADAVRSAHLRWVERLAAAVEAGWFGSDQPVLLARALTDKANVQAALGFSLGAPERRLAGLRIATALWPFWISGGLPSEGRHWLDRLLQGPLEPRTELLTGLWVHGFLTALDGDVTAGRRLVDRGRELALRLDDDAGLAHAAQMMGLAELLGGDAAEAVVHLEGALRLERRQPGFNPYLPFAIVNLGAALLFAEQVDRGVQVLQEAKALCSESDEQLLLSWITVYLGLAALLRHDTDVATAYLADGLQRKVDLDDSLGMIFALEFLAWAALEQDDAERAARLMGATEALAGPRGRPLAGLRRLVEWHDERAVEAAVRLGQGAFDRARSAGRELTQQQAVAIALGSGEAPAPSPDDNPIALLTPRQREIARLVASGRTNREIAAHLVIAHRTVDTHVEHVLAKLGFRSRTQIATLFATSEAAADRT